MVTNTCTTCVTKLHKTQYTGRPDFMNDILAAALELERVCGSHQNDGYTGPGSEYACSVPDSCCVTYMPSDGVLSLLDSTLWSVGWSTDLPPCQTARCPDVAHSINAARRCILLCYFSRLTLSVAAAAAAPGTRIVVKCLPQATRAGRPTSLNDPVSLHGPTVRPVITTT